jgi:hypothetical protein
MKTLLSAGALAALVTLGGSVVETWAGYGAHANRAQCDQICSHQQNVPQEQCMKRCAKVLSKKNG